VRGTKGFVCWMGIKCSLNIVRAKNLYIWDDC
jgi:hypothetical protein